MKFRATVTYQVHDNSVMTKELSRVSKVETIKEMLNGEYVDLFRVHHTNAYTVSTWAGGAVLHVNLMPERE